MYCSNLHEITVILFLQQDVQYGTMQDLFFVLLLCPSYYNIHRKQIQCVYAKAHFRLQEYTLLQTHAVTQQCFTWGLASLCYHIQTCVWAWYLQPVFNVLQSLNLSLPQFLPGAHGTKASHCCKGVCAAVRVKFI